MIDSPPLRASASRSSLSQRGLQAAGNLRSATTMSASAHSRTVSDQRRKWRERNASSRHRRPLWSICATQTSGEQRPNGAADKRQRLAIEPRRFGQERADIVAAPLAQDMRLAALADDDDVAAVPGDHRSGVGASAAIIAPSAIGASPARRNRLSHKHSHSPPPIIKAKADTGSDAMAITAPLACRHPMRQRQQQRDRPGA